MSDIKNMLGVSLQDCTGPINDLLKKLGSPEGVEWLAALKRFLRKEDPWQLSSTKVVVVAPPAPPVVVPTQTEFALQVNYDRSIEDARKDGKYDSENSDITSKNFPTARKGTADIVLHLIHFDLEISSEDAKAEMDKRGLRPAETHELLALGKDHPELQRQFPIVALTSVWRDRLGSRHVPCLDRNGSKRDLDLYWFVNGWYASYRFAAVPK